MTAFLNVVLAVLGLTATLAGFGGETWRKGDQPLKERMTTRGWVALSGLLLAFTVGIAKEGRTNTFAAKAAAQTAAANRTTQQLLTDIAGGLTQVKQAVARAEEIGIPIAPVRAGAAGPRELRRSPAFSSGLN